MEKDTIILLTEDEPGHADLIKIYLKQNGIGNQMINFSDGQKVLDYLFRHGSGPHRQSNTSYILLLDLKLPVVSGCEVMESLNKDTELKKIPAIAISTSDNQEDIKKCKNFRCLRFIHKPVDPKEFAETMGKLAQYLINLEVPRI